MSSSGEELLEEVLEEVMVGDDSPVLIYADENPYEVVEKDIERQYYQVVGNEIITITRGKGVCCLCGNVADILYTDNTDNRNIPVQICMPCIDAIMEK